jgi:DNA-directed RNA polymerase specialized sigma24 family protein
MVARGTTGPKRDEAQYARILELALKGLDTSVIAARLGCSVGHIAKVVRRAKAQQCPAALMMKGRSDNVG